MLIVYQNNRVVN